MDKLEIWRNRKKELGLTNKKIAEKANLPLRTVEQIMCGTVKSPRLDSVQAIERALELDTQLINKDPVFKGTFETESVVQYEEIGTICAGYNGCIDEIPTGKVVDIPIRMLSGRDPSDFFTLRVKGNSMYPRLIDGDTILCLRCNAVDSGSYAVVLIDGDEATVKKVNYVDGEDWLELIPINPEYSTKRIEGHDLELCRILGKVVKLIRDL